MSEDIRDQQAFPSHPEINYEAGIGMTLRDYFAAKIVSSMFANNEMFRNMHKDRSLCTRDRKNDTFQDYFAQQAYEMADAMLKERVK